MTLRNPTQFQYHRNWRNKANLTRRIQPLCTNNPLHGKADSVHHLKYKRSPLRRFLGIFLFHFPSVSVSGYEIPGYDCVPVCNHCHQNYYGRGSDRHSVHHPSIWKQVGGMNNHQTASKAWELRFKFWMLVFAVKFRSLF